MQIQQDLPTLPSMRIQYCSDLHLEFPINKKYMAANAIKPEGEILLLAGDIIPFSMIDEVRDFFDFVADNFKHTYWLPGNHEYYRSDIAQRTGTFQENIRSNVTLLNNSIIEYPDVRLVCSTLWSAIDPAKAFVIQKSMADFHLIKNNGQKLSTDAYNGLHEACRTFITSALQTASPKATVVMSHHIPTAFHYPEKYRYSELNSAFATELFDLIESTSARYWIYGHSHAIVPDFTIGNTILTSNQLGYVEYGEHLDYAPRTLTL